MSFLARLLVVLVVALAGCATTNVPSDYSLGTASKSGVAIASITYEGAYSGYNVYYRQLSGIASGRFQAGHGMMLIPIPDKSDFGTVANGKLVVAELPPGDYEISSWRVSSGYAAVSPSSSFSIRFHIDPGKAVYVGNFNFVQTARRGLTVTGAEVAFKGEPDRDLAVLKSKYPNFADTPIAFATPSDVSIQKLGGTDNLRFDIPIFIRR
jgi:hypothetical protein